MVMGHSFGCKWSTGVRVGNLSRLFMSNTDVVRRVWNFLSVTVS